jgi:uncharacterized membrane protein YcjF (UPF0283 family)
MKILFFVSFTNFLRKARLGLLFCSRYATIKAEFVVKGDKPIPYLTAPRGIFMKQTEKTNKTALQGSSKAQRYAADAQAKETKETKDTKEDVTGFSDSMSDAFKQNNEKKFFALILAAVVIIVLLVAGALSNLLTLCFQINRWFGYTMVAITAILICLFILRPIAKVLCARFFITDVASDKCDMARRRNYRALKDVSRALVEYNTAPKNARFRYLSVENTSKISNALRANDKAELKAALKTAYSTDVATCANSLIWKNAGRVFLTTSISQNDKVDALSVLLINISLVKQIVGIYGYRPSYAKLFRIYVTVLRNSLIAYGMQNVNWFNVFGKFFAGIARKIPFIDTIVDSAVQGTVSAFLTVLVGYKTKKYLCSDYKKQEKMDIDETESVNSDDDEVKIASVWANEIRKQNEHTAKAAE